jgi:hypothetical protein
VSDSTIRPGTLIGPYRLGDLLGRGGMAVVYEATHESIGRTVAVKLLSGEIAQDVAFVERFRREGRLHAGLEHPHVATVYEAGRWEHGLYLAMQLIRGPTLAELIDRGALTVQRSLTLLGQVADALDAVHAAGLVHRDVKPRNVLVAPGDHAYLADFGLTTAGDASSLTVTGHMLGTVAYLSPEVIKGHPATGASDRYAFAAMLFECLSGDVVFARRTHAALLYAHTTEPPPLISARRRELPAALDGVFVDALAKDPASRPQSAAALVADVTRILREHEALELGPPPPAERARSDEDTTAGTTDSGEEATDAAAGAHAAGGLTAVAGRRPLRTFAAGLLLGAIVAGVAVAVAGGDDDQRAVPVAARAVAPLPGARVLGSDLAGSGKTVDCRGAAPTATAPDCTLMQDTLGGEALVVPRDGVIRRWELRSGRGEFALAVLRRRGSGYFQIARSRNEFATDPRPHTFATDLAVERGDRLGLVVIAGSAVGIRPKAGATTARWLPQLGGDIEPSKGGPDGELLFGADYLPGGAQRLPKQVTGAAAERLPDGKIARHRPVTLGNGRKLTVDLVKVGGLYKLDLLRGKARVSRIAVPDVIGDGEFLDFNVGTYPSDRAQFYVFLRWVGSDSERVISHYLGGDANEFAFVD